MIAHRYRGCRNPIAPVLICEIRHITQIELRPHKNAVREGDLETCSEVDLEMVRTPHRRNLVRAYRGPDTGILGNGEAGFSAANSALQLHSGSFRDVRLI